MEQEKLTIVEVTLNKLKEKILEDDNMKEMFSTHFPELDYEVIVEKTIAQMYEYAVDKDYDILDLSLQGVRAFFESVFNSDEEDDENDNNKYGKA
jgi:predicted RNA-binding protein with PUA domain